MSEIKVNKISPRSGTGVQLGDSGDTFTIPAGATITNSGTAVNFGATGSASWVTSSIKTSTFTATAGEGYFCNTTAGAFTVNLPAGSAGAVVAVKDYAQTFNTNALTVAPNGSDKIGSSTDDVVLNDVGIAVTLVFVDSTQGWLVTDSGLQSEAQVAKFITASGGTETTSGNFKIHTFTAPGTFTVSCAGNSAGSSSVDYLVVAGGGSGGTRYSGGGGGGGYRESSGAVSGCYSISPKGSGVAALAVTATAFPIVVGGGGAGVSEGSPTCVTGNRGSNSSFSTIISTGGGGGIKQGSTAPAEPNSPGGSGGGGSYNAGPAGVGDTPSVSPPQGNPGGTGVGNPHYSSGGGGGATAVGTNGTTSVNGTGGAGATSCITASPVGRSGGGGAGVSINHPTSAGGASPCGSGTAGGTSPGSTTTAGAANRGGGSGGGYSYPGNSGNGGSGIVVIRYKFQ